MGEELQISIGSKSMPTARASRAPCVDQINTDYLESLLGYNARRAALVIIELFLKRMAVYELRPVEFSVISLIVHNPGITSRQLCGALGLLPPNLVGMIGTFERRGLIARRPHPTEWPRQWLASDACRRKTDAGSRKSGAGSGERCDRDLDVRRAENPDTAAEKSLSWER